MLRLDVLGLDVLGNECCDRRRLERVRRIELGCGLEVGRDARIDERGRLGLDLGLGLVHEVLGLGRQVLRQVGFGDRNRLGLDLDLGLDLGLGLGQATTGAGGAG